MGRAEAHKLSIVASHTCTEVNNSKVKTRLPAFLLFNFGF
jgi:hypothetical protein